MNDETSTVALPRDLGDGLVLRAATPDDAEAVADLNAHIHVDWDTGEPSEEVRIITQDLMTGHPCTRPSDFSVVEDTRTGQLVSTVVLIGQTWTYAGIPFGVGRVELVGTLPEYRRRGLIRAQMDLLHAWSAERGQLMQVVTGIPNYYRQFGYEMAMNLGGGRDCYRWRVPKLEAGQEEPYRLRPATVEDVPFLKRTYDYASQRYLINCVYDEAMMRYELTARHPQSECKVEMRIIETPEGEPVGYLAIRPRIEREALATVGYELAPGVSWLAVTPSALRHLATLADELAAKEPQTTWVALALHLGAEHPLYEAVPRCLGKPSSPYAFYVRVPDRSAFIRRITPALEERLAGSLAAGHSAELKLSFYRSGLRLVLERGKVAVVEPWDPVGQRHVSAQFPDHTFLKLLTGYQTLEEIHAGYPDCGVHGDEADYLLRVLFPRGLPPIWFIE
ncbi:MAG: GNAT family N-acetyltransferase [Anaerolineae bacterium]|nr:GNAT family N-acetyltransferase [Anaerolineae bacterium]